MAAVSPAGPEPRIRTFVSSGPSVPAPGAVANGTAARGAASPAAPKSIVMPPKGEVMSDIGRAGLVLGSAAGTRGTGPYASTTAILPGSIQRWWQPVRLTPTAARGARCGHPGGRACSLSLIHISEPTRLGM